MMESTFQTEASFGYSWQPYVPLVGKILNGLLQAAEFSLFSLANAGLVHNYKAVNQFPAGVKK